MNNKYNTSEIKITGDNKSAVTSMDGVITKIGELDRSANQLSSGGIANLTSQFKNLINPTTMAVGALTMAGGAITAAFKNTIDLGDNLYKMSQRVGMTVEELSKLKYAAEMNGVELSELESFLNKFNKTINETVNGAKSSREAFKTLEISIKNSKGALKNNNDLLLEIAEKFSQMPDGVKKSTLAMEIFGKSGSQMIPFLNQGKNGIEELTRKAKDLGLEMSTSTAKSAEEFNDKIADMGKKIEGTAISIGSKLLPHAIKLADTLDPLLKKGADAFAEGLGSIVRRIGDIISIGTKLSGQKWFNTLIKLGAYPLFVGEGSEIKMDEIDKYFNPEKYKKYADMLEKTYNQPIELMPYKGAGNSINDNLSEDENKNKKKKFHGWAVSLNEASYYMKLFEQDYLNTFMKMKKMKAPLDPLVESVKFGTMQMTEITGFNLALIEANYNETYNRINEDLTALQEEQLTITSNTFGNMSAAFQNFNMAFGRDSNAMFSMHKAFATAQVIIDGIKSVQAAYAQGMVAGGPWLAAAYAISAGIFSASQLAAIHAARPGSSGGMRTPAYNVPSPTRNNNAQAEQIVTINVYGSVVNYDQFAREFMPALRKAERDGA